MASFSFDYGLSVAGHEVVYGLRAEISRFFKVRATDQDARSISTSNKSSKMIGDESYYMYEIIVTNPSPFNRWLVSRRYSDFREVYKHLKVKCGRKLRTQFPGKSLITSGKALAGQRVPLLDDFLHEVLSLPDITVKEIDKLYSFLEVGKNCYNVEAGGSSRIDSDALLDDDLHYDFDDDIATDGEMDREASRSVEKICVKETLHPMRYSDMRETLDLGAGSPHSRFGGAGGSSYTIESNSLHRTYAVTAEGMKEALRNNDLVAVREMLQKSKGLATDIDDAGNPVIYTAALYGSIELALELITAGADPYAKNLHGSTAMEVAFEPWKIAVLDHIAELERLKAEENSPFQEFVVDITKDASGSLGLNIVKSREGLPLIVGFKPRSKDSTTPSPDSLVMPNDVIIGVNECISQIFEELVHAIRCSEGVVRLRIRRERVQLSS